MHHLQLPFSQCSYCSTMTTRCLWRSSYTSFGASSIFHRRCTHTPSEVRCLAHSGPPSLSILAPGAAALFCILCTASIWPATPGHQRLPGSAVHAAVCRAVVTLTIAEEIFASALATCWHTVTQSSPGKLINAFLEAMSLAVYVLKTSN